MCTVTYLPLRDGYLLTSNRDERLSRKISEQPAVQQIGNCRVLFPRDADAGGTWIAASDNNRSVCLLNGAFYPHMHSPPYRKSRGLVILDYFNSPSANDFKNGYDLQDIEPFTMLMVETGKIFELRWDGKNKYFKTLDETQPHILSSVTLYTPEVAALREQWFADWLKKHNTYIAKDILAFHLFAGDRDDYTRIRMSRAGLVETVSVTCIQICMGNVKMFYADAPEGKTVQFGVYSLPVEGEPIYQTEELTIAT